MFFKFNLNFWCLMTWCLMTCCILQSCRPWFLDIHAIEFSSEMRCDFSRLLVLFLATVLQRFTVGLCQSLSVRRPSITQMQHRMPVARASAQAVIYVQELQQHLRFASVHGMSSPSRHFPGDPMRGPQQLQIIIVRWTCRHVYWNSSRTCGDLSWVLQLLP
jgi:hypothetical protein